jgi:predicted ATPase/class 3 adenylate cyclase
MNELEQLRQAITALETQRAVLGDAIVDAALAPMREKLAALTAQETPADPQLKYLTILFTDIAGSTRLTQGLDPEDIMVLLDGALKHLSAVVEKFGGRATRFMGDGFKAVFGLDLAHEDDAERAVHAGLALLEAAKTFAAQVERDWGRRGFDIRVGINSGSVAVGGFSEAGDTIMGLTVNLAARLESAAPVGSVLISHHTYQHVRDVFDVQPLAPIIAKGFAEPVPVYMVVRAKPHSALAPKSGVQGVATRMIGRTAEFKQLQDIYHTVRQTGHTQAAIVLGDPGVGKSRLLYEFEHWLEQQPEPARYFKGRATSILSSTPYALLRDMFAETLGILDNDPVAVMRQKIETGLARILDSEADMKAHFIGALLGFDFGDSPHLLGVQNDPQQLRQRAMFYLEQFLAGFARQALTIILLEDIHWADRSSSEAIRQLVRRCPDLRLLIVGLARPALREGDSAWDRELRDRPGVYRPIELSPLPPDASDQLVREILQKLDAPPDELRQVIVATAEGNPFFVEELIKSLIDDGVIHIDRATDTWQIDPHSLHNLHVPPTLTALLQARLASLSPAERSTLQQAAVAGRIFWDTLLQALQSLPQPPVHELDHLAQRELIHARSTPAFAQTHEYIFQHALLRDVVYDTVLKRTRQTYHAQTAVWLIKATRAQGRTDEYAAVIAEHYALAGEPGLAADWYRQAGERAKAQGAFLEARKFFDHALDLLPPAVDREQRWRILLEHNEVLGVLRDAEARQADDRALLALAHEIGDDNHLAEAHYRTGTYSGMLGDHAAERRAYEAALLHARRAGNRTLETQVLGALVFCLTRLSEMQAAATTAEEVLALAPHLTDELKYSHVLNNVAVHYMEAGDIARSAQLMQVMVEINHRLGNRLGEASGLLNLGYNFLLLGLFERCRTSLEQAQQLMEATGARRESAYSLLNLGLVYWRSGDAATAQRTLEQALRELVEISDRFGEAAGRSYLGLVCELAGDANQAVHYFTAAATQFDDIGARGYAADARAGLARNELQRARRQDAHQAASEVWDYLNQHGPQGLEFPMRAYLTCAEVFAAVGLPVQAQAARAAGYQELHTRAARISNAAWRQSYLENIPEHHALNTQPMHTAD